MNQMTKALPEVYGSGASLRGPIVRCDNHSLYEHACLGGQHGMFEFTQAVYWVRSSCAEVWLRHGGKSIINVATYCDTGMLLACVENALARLEMTCEEYRIDRKSSLEAVVTVSIVDTPCVDRSPANARNVLSPGELVAIRNSWFYEQADYVSEEDRYKPLIKHPIIEGHHLICSKGLITRPKGSLREVSAFVNKNRRLCVKAQQGCLAYTKSL